MRWIWIIAGVTAVLVAVTNAAAGANVRALPAGRSQVAAFDVNDQRVIVGGFSGVNGASSQGFVLRHGVFTALNVPGSARHATVAKGVNNVGDVVGDYLDPGGRMHGYLLHDGTYTTLNVPGRGNQTCAYEINAAGDIVGTYLDRSGADHGFLRHDGRYTTIRVP